MTASDSHEKMWTMKVSDSNREFLQSMCAKNEPFDSAISRLIKAAKVTKNQVKEITV